jgi:hypothetical protein
VRALEGDLYMELQRAGAACVFERIEDLLAKLDETPLSAV